MLASAEENQGQVVKAVKADFTPALLPRGKEPSGQALNPAWSGGEQGWERGDSRVRGEGPCPSLESATLNDAITSVCVGPRITSVPRKGPWFMKACKMRGGVCERVGGLWGQDSPGGFL